MAETCSSKRSRPNGSEPETALNSTKRQTVRKRAPLACEECRMRKRRCDGAVPICGGCTKRMSSCVYLAELQEKAWHHGMIKTLRNRLSELERVGQQRYGLPVDMASQDDTIMVNTQNQSPHEQVADVPQTRSPQSNNDQASSSQAPATVPDLGTTADISAAAPTGPGSLSVTTPYGSPSGTSGGLDPGSVERLMRPIDQAIGKASLEQGPISIPSVTTSVPMSAITLNKTLPPCSCNELLGGGDWSLPLRRQADDLVRLYFSRVHRMYPILHKPTFMRQYKQLWEPAAAPSPANPGLDQCSGLCRQKSLDKTFPAMVNAVFALASLFASGPLEQNSARAGGFFSQAQQVDLLDIIDEEVGIELVQLLLLMGFYLQSTERFSKCWNITGLAIRMAQNMGLQLNSHEARRKGLLATCPSQLESEMRVRVWYGCVLLDREISMSFGRPLMINNSGERLRLPEAIDDEFLSEEPGGKRNSQPSDCPSLLESYIQTINLYDIMGQVLDREEAKDAEDESAQSSATSTNLNSDTQSLLDLDTRIMEWKDALPPYLQYEPPGTTEDEARQGSSAASVSSRPRADSMAQAKKVLHARFLHVRVLILRPALEHLFRKQRKLLHRSQTRPGVTRVQDIMVSSIAAQCALSAESLVRSLDTHIRSQSLVAWWYNVGYLHTAGSTLLMGQLCSLNDSALLNNGATLSESWQLCLECLSRYTGLSSIASKSFNLLQESARRLLVPHHMATTSYPTGNMTSIGPGLSQADQAHQQRQHNDPAQVLALGQRGINGGDIVNTSAMTNTQARTNHAGGGGGGREEQPTFVPLNSNHQHSQHELLDPALLDENTMMNGGGQRELLHGEDLNGALDASAPDAMWAGNLDPSSNTYWPFMPFLSQLESLPHDFDMSGLEA